MPDKKIFNNKRGVAMEVQALLQCLKESEREKEGIRNAVDEHIESIYGISNFCELLPGACFDFNGYLAVQTPLLTPNIETVVLGTIAKKIGLSLVTLTRPLDMYASIWRKTALVGFSNFEGNLPDYGRVLGKIKVPRIKTSLKGFHYKKCLEAFCRENCPLEYNLSHLSQRCLSLANRGLPKEAFVDDDDYVKVLELQRARKKGIFWPSAEWSAPFVIAMILASNGVLFTDDINNRMEPAIEQIQKGTGYKPHVIRVERTRIGVTYNKEFAKSGWQDHFPERISVDGRLADMYRLGIKEASSFKLADG